MSFKAMPIFIILFLIESCLYAHPGEIQFYHPNDKGVSITIAAVGDILLHQPLQVKGIRYGFKSLWQEAIPYLKNADIAYANLEGPIANNLGYTGYPAFNYHPSVANALQETGIDIVSTANNHALDRASIGIQKTLANLDQVQIKYVGTRTKKQDNSEWIRIIEKNNIKTAWIACTEHTNDIDDVHQQVLRCYSKTGKSLILNTVQSLKNKVDAIIVTPHWGEEYSTRPNRSQIKFAHDLLNAGAILVIGSHPHVLQPLEKFITNDGRETLVAYSLGNFVSYQGSPRTKTTIVLLVSLTKTLNGTVISNLRYVPMEMRNREGIDQIRVTKIKPNANSVIMDVMPLGNACPDSILIHSEKDVTCSH